MVSYRLSKNLYIISAWKLNSYIKGYQIKNQPQQDHQGKDVEHGDRI